MRGSPTPAVADAKSSLHPAFQMSSCSILLKLSVTTHKNSLLYRNIQKLLMFKWDPVNDSKLLRMGFSREIEKPTLVSSSDQRLLRHLKCSLDRWVGNDDSIIPHDRKAEVFPVAMVH